MPRPFETFNKYHGHRQTKGRGIAAALLALFAPPLAHHLHGRYEGRRLHLFFDTLLALLLLFLAGLNILLATRPEPAGQDVLIRIAQPSTTAVGGEAAILLQVESAGPVVENVVIEFTTDGFLLQSSSPQPHAGEMNQWNFPALNAGEPITITLDGYITAAPHTEGALRALAQFEREGVSAAAASVTRFTTTESDVQLTAESLASVESGDSYTVDAAVVNASTAPVQNLGVELQSEFPFAPREQAKPILWFIDRLEPNATAMNQFLGTLATNADQSFPIDLSLIRRVNEQRIVLQTIHRELVVRGTPAAEEIVASPKESGLQFAAEAHYYSAAGVQLGYGPLPPEVGKTTGYRIIWVALAQSEVFDDVVIRATIPPGTRWAGHVTVTHGDTITYASDSRSMTWRIGTVLPEDGVISGSFEVTVTPTKSDIGDILSLLGSSTLTAVDSLGDTVRDTVPVVTSDLSDEGARNKGAVVE